MTRKISWGVDLYRSVVFPLNADGTFQIPEGTDAYEGLQFEGSRSFNITPAEVRPIDNYGDGRLRDTIYLPPNTSTRGELLVGYEHQELNAALLGVEQFTEGGRTLLPMSTDKQGTEPIVALFLMQMAHDISKLKNWRFYQAPRAQCIPYPSSFNDTATEMRYQVTFSPSDVTFWNDELNEEDHGCTEAAYFSGLCEDRPNIVMFQGDGLYDVVFNLPTNKPAVSTTKINVYNLETGAEVTVGFTKTTTDLTFDSAPDYQFLVSYEY